MKIRQFFVSNSSSSSFIITDKKNFDKAKEILKNNYYDWYEYKDILYTSRIHDSDDTYFEISELSNESFDCYERDYIEIEGQCRQKSVYVPPEIVLQIANANKVYDIVEKFMAENDILDICCQSGDEDLCNFFDKLYKIIYNTEESLFDNY